MKQVRAVRRFALKCATGSLALVALALPGTAPAACKIQQLAEIPVQMDGYRPLIDGSINGRPVKLLADTGSDKSMLLRSALSRLGLHPLEVNGVTFYGVGGSSTAEYVTVDHIQIGSINSKDINIFVAGENSDHTGIDGYLGADFLGQSDIEIDLAHGVVRILRPTECSGDDVVYWHGPYSVEKLIAPPGLENEFLVNVTVDGRALVAQIDSGAENSVISGQGARKLGLDLSEDLKASGDSSVGLGKEHIKIKHHKFNSFKFDSEEVKYPNIDVGDIFLADREPPLGSRARQDVMSFPDMLLGADFLLTHRVYIATSQGKIYVSYTGGKPFVTHLLDDPTAK